MYDPFQHADQLGLHVEWGNPGQGNLGLWTGNKIILLHDLNQREARSVLAHEIVHAQYDPPLIHKYLSPRVETRADRIAAERLIDPTELARLETAYEDRGQIAYELNVTLDILNAYTK